MIPLCQAVCVWYRGQNLCWISPVTGAQTQSLISMPTSVRFRVTGAGQHEAKTVFMFPELGLYCSISFVFFNN